MAETKSADAMERELKASQAEYSIATDEIKGLRETLRLADDEIEELHEAAVATAYVPTARDFYAAAALTGILAGLPPGDLIASDSNSAMNQRKDYVQLALIMAEAMMETR